MKHPTKKQFLLCIKALCAPLLVRTWIATSATATALLNGRQDLVESAAQELIEEHRQAVGWVYSQECMTWFDAQSEFCRAREAAFKGAFDVDIHVDYGGRLFVELCDTLRDLSKTAHAARAVFGDTQADWGFIEPKLQAIFDQLGYSLRTKWMILILTALYEHFFVPNAVERYLEQRKKIEKLAKRVEDGLKAQDELFRLPLPSESLWFQRSTQAGRSSAELLHSQQDIREALQRALHGVVPIARNDESAPHRLLIYRLWLANKLAFNTPRLPAIALFMQSQVIDDGPGGPGVKKVVGNIDSRFNESGVKKVVDNFGKNREDYVLSNQGYFENLIAETRAGIVGR